MSNRTPAAQFGVKADGRLGFRATDPSGAIIIDTDLPGGGLPGGAGNVKVYAWDFTYATAGLSTGHVFYLPAAGDVLIDGWVETTTFWAAAGGCYMDVFSDNSGASGIFSNGNSPVNLKAGTHAGSPDYVDGNVRYQYANGHTTILSGQLYPRPITTDPLTLWVTSNGTRSGADPAATAGAATLYLAIASPGAHTVL